MTREEAWRRTKGYLIDVLSAEEADEIIKALEQQEDTISRQAVLGIFGYVIDYWKEHAIDVEPHEIKDALIEQYEFTAKQLSDLPPVTPQPEKCGDCISRRAIIGKCEDTAKATSDIGEMNTGFIMALDFIADYAKYLPSVVPELKPEKCGDCISRQDVLDLAERGKLVSNGNYKSVCDAINGLPSVEPDVNKQKAISELQPPTDNWGTYADRLYDLAYLSGYNDGLVAKRGEEY